MATMAATRAAASASSFRLDLLAYSRQHLDHSHPAVSRRLDVQASLVRLDDHRVGALVDHVPDDDWYLHDVSDDPVGYGDLVGDDRGCDGPARVATI